MKTRHFILTLFHTLLTLSPLFSKTQTLDHKKNLLFLKFWRVDFVFDNFDNFIKKWGVAPNIPRFWGWNQLDILLPAKCKV